MSGRPTVVLFDIDGTLVSCGGAGRRALTAAFLELHARDDVFRFSFAGLTDRAIVRAGLRAAGVADDESSIDAVIERYLLLLPELVARSPGYQLMPGVVELVTELEREAELAIGLGTGNVRAGAMTKLGRAGLTEHFSFGGFGCDHEDRSLLLAIGAERGAQRLSARRADCRVIVIGDTPLDVVAAHAISAECIAVETGGHEAFDLGAAGAELVVQDLGSRRIREHLLTPRC